MRLSTNDPDDYHQQTSVGSGGAAHHQRGTEQNQPGVGQYTQLQGGIGGGSYSSTANNKTLGNQRKLMAGSAAGGGGDQGPKVATISQNYNEKSLLLSSDDECQ